MTIKTASHFKIKHLRSLTIDFIIRHHLNREQKVKKEDLLYALWRNFAGREITSSLKRLKTELIHGSEIQNSSIKAADPCRTTLTRQDRGRKVMAEKG